MLKKCYNTIMGRLLKNNLKCSLSMYPTSVQPSKLNNQKTSILLLKRTFFSNIQLWRMVFFNPVGIQKRTVSHFKGLFKTFKMRYSMFLYSNWIGLHVHFKKAILHLKRATVSLYTANSKSNRMFAILWSKMAFF